MFELKSFVKLLAILLATVLASVCLLYAGEISGFNMGTWAQINDDFSYKNSGFSIGVGPSVYEFIYQKYSIIAFCLYVYVFGKWVRKSFYSDLVCVLSTVPPIYLFWQLIQYKVELFKENFPYNEWMSKTIRFDWEGFGIVAIVLLAELVFLFIGLHRAKSKLEMEVAQTK